MTGGLRGGGWLPALTLGLLAACNADTPGRDAPAVAGSAPRIVTLSPHLAELVDAVGARDLLVGVSAYTSFGSDVTLPPEIGDAFVVDLESLSLIEPDLVLAWASGTPQRTIEELRDRGYRVESVVTENLADVASALVRIGDLTGHSATAERASSRYLQRLASLRQQQSGKPPIRVFYQISAKPLYTINGAHFLSELIELCGGRNVFSDLAELAPLVSEEAVLARDPETVLTATADPAGAAADAFAGWRRWSTLAANRYDNYFVIDSALVARPTPRLVDGGQAMCQALDESRRHRRLADRKK
ncbi:MAG: helical backbone metal receptor [Woeseiaceae bacterium]|nr:helical backbone metal receptor [Woeseiaceae bacterium]